MHMIRLITILAVGVLFLQSCKKDEVVPNVRFEICINLLQPKYSGTAFALNSVEEDYWGDRMQVGYSGVIVYNVGGDRYNAFERYCPHDRTDKCKVSLKNDDSAVCSCCKTEFLTMTGEVIKNSGPSKYGLKQYKATKNSNNTLIISN